MRLRSLFSLLFTTLIAGAAAQNTVPHWSTWFGGALREEGVLVRRGPGPLVTLVGHTRSDGLFGSGGVATAGALQTSNVAPGVDDVFVARFDPRG